MWVSSPLPQDLIVALKALGHKHETANHFYNVVNAVEKEAGCICAVSDARKLGEAAGYWDQEPVTLVMKEGLNVTETILQPQTHKCCNRWYMSCWKKSSNKALNNRPLQLNADSNM